VLWIFIAIKYPSPWPGLNLHPYSGPKLMTLSTGQLAQLEERNAELESHNSTVMQQNLELQQVERELRDNLLTFVSHSELQDVQNKLHKSEQDRVCAPKMFD
jgi:uncharacterized protein YigA (DUF484 family)